MSSNFERGVAKEQFPGKKPTSLEQKATLRLNTFDGLEIPANQLRLVVTGCFEQMYFAITGGARGFQKFLNHHIHKQPRIENDKKNQLNHFEGRFLEAKNPKTTNPDGECS